MTRAVLALFFLATICFGSAPAQARPYRSSILIIGPDNLYGGAGLVATHIVRQDGGPELLEDGVGFDVYGGVRVGKGLALELGWVQSFHNPAVVDTYYGTDVDYLVVDALTADARIYLQASDPLEFYLLGGLGAYALSSQYFGLDSIGSGFQLGAGLDIFIGESLTIGGRAVYRGMLMGPPDSNIRDTFVSALTLHGTIALHL
jgi:hypothetical protein